MGEGSPSALHVWCFSYINSASCVYKTVCLYDFLYFGLSFLSTVGYTARENRYDWPSIVTLIAAVLFLYCSFMGIVLFCGYNSNLSDGSIYQKTHSYLAVRKLFVIAYFIYAIAVPIIIIAGTYLIMDADKTRSLDDKNKIKATAVGVGIAFGIQYLIAAWLQACFQKSLDEAVGVITGRGPLVQDAHH